MSIPGANQIAGCITNIYKTKIIQMYRKFIEIRTIRKHQSKRIRKQQN